MLTTILIKPNSVIVVHDKVMQEQSKGTHNAWTQNIPCIAKTYNGYINFNINITNQIKCYKPYRFTKSSTISSKRGKHIYLNI